MIARRRKSSAPGSRAVNSPFREVRLVALTRYVSLFPLPGVMRAYLELRDLKKFYALRSLSMRRCNQTVE